MKSFENYNPIVVTVYFLSVIGILMFAQDPLLLLFAFAGVFSYTLIKSGAGSFRLHLFFLLIFVVLALINPLVSHNGKTVLFVINDAPITLEATVYGIVMAGTIVSCFYLFHAYTQIMTRDKLLYVFGKLSPKLCLVLSMGLRYTSLFKDRAKKIADSQRALGLYKKDNILDKIKSDLRVFSILITWALENGITTADSMTARGYGKRRRTYYSLFKFQKADALLLMLTLVCTVFTACALGFLVLDFSFYPSICFAPFTPFSIASYVSYGILTFLPVAAEAGDRIKWKYLRSKI